MTVPQAFQLAVQHHQAGRLAEAETIYRQILAVEPQHADALQMLGLIAHQVGRSDAAIDLMHQAVALSPNDPVLHANLGEAYRKAGRVDDAIGECRRALQLRPAWAGAHFNLGTALAEKGQTDDAIEAYRRAIELNAEFSEAHNGLGVALRAQGRLDEAIKAYCRALELKPCFAAAYNNLGDARLKQGRYDEAIEACCQSLQLRPDCAEAHHNIAIALLQQGRLDEAIASFRRALEFKPNYVEAHHNLGNVLRDQGQLDEAITEYRRALALRPGFAEAHNNLGSALSQQGQLDDALASLHTALELQPDMAEAHNNLGSALSRRGRLDEAIASYRRALELRPDFAEVLSNLGNALKDQGLVDAAIAAYRKARRLQPDCAETHSNLLLSLHYAAKLDAEGLFREHSHWDEVHARPLGSCIEPPANDPSPDRRLRIGYVSPDFWSHSVAFFLENLLASHDPAQVEVFAYADLRRADAVTARLRAHASHWREITGMTDAQVAKLIREDQIDILVDLAGHTAGNRLLVFARRPAPVQVTYLGYCDTTGLQAMDYRFTDAHADPPGLTEHLHSEQLIRLPEGAWCFRPSDEAPPVSDLPALHTGCVTFGCFNALPKITDQVLEGWSRILRAVPGSRLLLKNLSLRDDSARARVRDLLEKAGLDANRVEMLGQMPTPAEHLRCYQRMDLALDTFPYHGTTTTCEALWMGVPVITLAGSTHASRVGVSLLSKVGLPELIAHSLEQYVEIAAALAADLPRLAAQRAGLRQRMAASPLLDGPRFARHVETAYRQIWRTWCSKRSALPPS